MVNHGSYGVHPDLKGHSGGMMSLVKGPASRKSIRNMINSSSSKELEIIEVDDQMPGVIWTLRFLVGKGFKVIENIVYQDNQSAIFI